MVPSAEHSIRRSSSSGSHCICQVSRNVPAGTATIDQAPPVHTERPRIGEATASASGRWSCANRAQGGGAPPWGLRRHFFCWCARSRASGTIGVRSGTWPISVPITSSSLMSLHRDIGAVAEHRSGGVTDLGQARPGDDRATPPENDARRVASTTSAADIAKSARRNTHAASVNQRAMCRAGVWLNRWWYQPGALTPAPYPLR